ncbi:MAG: cation:proton antiporter, partial [Candidatus Micrarchaeota archaeon]
MLAVEVTLLIFGLTIFLGFFASVFFERTRIPDVLFLLLFGVLLGPILAIVNPNDFIPLASTIGTLALIVVLFDGGLHFDIKTILYQLPNAALFSTVVFIRGAVLGGGGRPFVLGWPFLHARNLGLLAGGPGANEVL